VDSIRQVDVDLNFLLLLYSTVGPCRLVCLFGRLDICWEIFWVGRIHWPPTQCYTWVGNCPPWPLGARTFVLLNRDTSAACADCDVAAVVSPGSSTWRNMVSQVHLRWKVGILSAKSDFRSTDTVPVNPRKSVRFKISFSGPGNSRDLVLSVPGSP